MLIYLVFKNDLIYQFGGQVFIYDSLHRSSIQRSETKSEYMHCSFIAGCTQVIGVQTKIHTTKNIIVYV